MPTSPYVLGLRQKIGHAMLMLQAASVAIFDAQGRILLGLHEEGRWMTIGGAIDPHESPADAAVREAWEETGLLVEPTRLIGVFGGPDFLITYANGDIVYYTAILFEARAVGGTLRPDGEEALALRYVSAEEAAGLTMAPRTRQLLAAAFARDAAPFFAPPTWTPPAAR